MPVRDKAVGYMMIQRYGTQVFDGRTGECRTMPDYDEKRKEADADFVDLVKSIDWHRVMLTASGRHMHLDHDDLDYCGAGFEGICPRCVKAALLDLDRTIDWVEDDG